MTVKIAKPKIETRQKFEELRKPSGIAGESMLRAKTAEEQQALLGVGRKNLLINSAFQISQRGDYTSATSMTTNGYVFGVDRWNNNTSNVAATFQQLTGYPTANENYMRMVATSSASGYYRMFQRVEGNFEGRVLTFSAWVKSNDSDARLITIATGGWVSNNKAKHSGSGLWEKLTLTVTAGDFDNPHFVIGNMSAAHGNTTVTAGDYIEVANPQVEIGTVSTPLEYRTIAEESTLCKRYFQSFVGPSYSGIAVGQVFNATSSMFSLTFSDMRAAPTASFSNLIVTDRIAYDSNISSFQVQGTGINTIGIKTVHASNSASARQACQLAIKNGGTGYLHLNAEL